MDDFNSVPKRHRRLRATSLFGLIALVAHYPALLMSAIVSSTAQVKPRAQWNDNEVAALVNYYHEHRSEICDGGNFKTPTYNAAAQAIAPFYTVGPVKTGNMCKTKWQTVSIILKTVLIDTHNT